MYFPSSAVSSVISVRPFFNGPLRSSATGLGRHGNSFASGSSFTNRRPSSVISLPFSPSMNTNVGMPWTLNFLDKLAWKKLVSHKVLMYIIMNKYKLDKNKFHMPIYYMLKVKTYFITWKNGQVLSRQNNIKLTD